MNFSRLALLQVFLEEELSRVRAAASADPRPPHGMGGFRQWQARDQIRWARQCEIRQAIADTRDPGRPSPKDPPGFCAWAKARLEREGEGRPN
jgi:hypothetical protein